MRIVQKFGGTSLADAEKIRAAAKKSIALAKEGWQVVTVVSAMGSSTDDMLERAKKVCREPSLREMDAYLAAAEQMSATWMAMAIEDLGHPAISLTGYQAGILTDSIHGNARIQGLNNDRVQRELDKGKVVVVAGFQGISPEGNITTLGRGGSDTTAVALAAFLGARLCRIYTDVDGVYDKDPRKYPDAVKLPVLGYDRMLIMAREGAQVLHDRSVEMGKLYDVPIQVLSAFRPGPGSFVTDRQLLQVDCPQF
ncbi:MAG: hypothetical protein IJW94_03090 [Oscillospiraceae bacterium]|nr:hypothetical protein [Oscillospiraceae bacterium]